MTDTDFVCYEKIDVVAIKWLLQQETLHNDPPEHEKIKNTLSSMVKSYKLQKCFKMLHKTSKKYNGCGRVYPYHLTGKVATKFGGLASLPRAIRGFLADKYNIDIDIKKCHWYIVKYLLIKDLNPFLINMIK
jgi:hypothetical protein